MNKDFDIEKIASEIDFTQNMFTNINGLMLTNREISVLEQYKINYKNCQSLKEILFQIEEVLNEMDITSEELEYIESIISERDYYQNTNK